MKKYLLSFLLLLLFVSCGYRLNNIGVFQGKSFQIPYIEKDEKGLLTQALIYELSSLGYLKYKTAGADLCLNVKILSIDSDKIGYRKDRDKDGSIRKNVMATENRITIKTKTCLIDRLSNEIVWGPKEISSDIDFDYVEQDSLQDLTFIDLNNSRETMLSFSLGQMESINSAENAAKKPLFKRLSQDISTALIAELGEDY